MKRTANISWIVLVLLSGLLLSSCEPLLVNPCGTANKATALEVSCESHSRSGLSVGQLTGEFKTVWKVPADDPTLRLPLVDGGRYDFTVDWGDGSSNTITKWDAKEATHTYTSQREYEVTITGKTFVGWRFVDANNAAKLIAVKSWGNMALGAVDSHFAEASNLVKFPERDKGTPDLRGTTSLKNTFNGAKNFNGNISAWNVSTVTDMSWMFQEAEAFNQDISAWDVSKVENMEGMFNPAVAFNNGGAPLDWGDAVKNVTNMVNMFRGAGNFNQPIGDWVVSAVTNMSQMFYRAEKFNQDISGWDVDQVEEYDGIFSECPIVEAYKPPRFR